MEKRDREIDHGEGTSEGADEDGADGVAKREERNSGSEEVRVGKQPEKT